MKTIIYTASFGMKPSYKLPNLLKCNYDFHCFSGPGGRAEAREVKLLPHKYFPGYDVSIWIDATTDIEVDNLPGLTEYYLEKGDFIVAEHLKKDNDIYKEAETCIEAKKESHEFIPKQIAEYKSERCPNVEVVNTRMIIRKHLKPDIIFFDEAWITQLLLHYSLRDQISFAYLAWKYGLKYVKMDYETTKFEFLKPELNIS